MAYPASRFIHSQCDQELFTTEYLRSNKASGHKNLRCFPHCCGGHNPKSFCGAGLVVECVLPYCQLVLGRFEEVAKVTSAANGSTSNMDMLGTPSLDHEDPSDGNDEASPNAAASMLGPSDPSAEDDALVIGHEYARKALFDELKTTEQPFGRWFKGVSIASTSQYPRFHLNGNRQSWHYGWLSSRLNCKNLHVFKVYFFQESATDPDKLLCLDALASTPFRISSSRKARKTFRSSSSNLSDDGIPTAPAPTPAMAMALATPMSTSSSSQDNSPNQWTDRLSDLSGQTSAAGGAGVPSPSMFPPEMLAHLAGNENGAKRFARTGLPMTALQSPADYFLAREFAAAEGLVDTRQMFDSDGVPKLSLSALLQSARSTTGNMDPLHAAGMLSSLEIPMMSRGAFDNNNNNAAARASAMVTPIADMMRLRMATPTNSSAPSPSLSPLSSQFGMHMPEPVPLTRSASSKRKRSPSFEAAMAAADANSAAIAHAAVSAANAANAGSPGYPFPPCVVNNDDIPREELSPEAQQDVYKRASLLALVYRIISHAKRVQFATEGASPSGRTMDCSSIAMGATTTWGVMLSTSWTTTKPSLVHVLSILINTARLLMDDGFLVTLRTWMRDLVAQDMTPMNTYAKLLDMVEKHVNRVVCHLLGHSWNEANPNVLTDLLRSVESELSQEEWWPGVRLQDASSTNFPHWVYFEYYFGAVREYLQYPTLEIPGIVSDSTMTGEWKCVDMSHDVSRIWDQSQEQLPITWVHHQLHSILWSRLRLIDTQARVTLALPNSLISADLPIDIELDLVDPVVVVPKDYHIQPWTRQVKNLAAYRAWRMRDVDDANGSAIAFQFAAWPDAQEILIDDSVAELGLSAVDPLQLPCRLLRTRLTSYFSITSAHRLQVRFVLEGCITDDPKILALVATEPNAVDMIEFFKSPTSWEMIMQFVKNYERDGDAGAQFDPSASAAASAGSSPSQPSPPSQQQSLQPQQSPHP